MKPLEKENLIFTDEYVLLVDKEVIPNTGDTFISMEHNLWGDPGTICYLDESRKNTCRVISPNGTFNVAADMAYLIETQKSRLYKIIGYRTLSFIGYVRNEFLENKVSIMGSFPDIVGVVKKAATNEPELEMDNDDWMKENMDFVRGWVKGYRKLLTEQYQTDWKENGKMGNQGIPDRYKLGTGETIDHQIMNGEYIYKKK